VVPYNTLLGEKHWSWYRKTHCQMKGTYLIWYHDQCISLGNVPYIPQPVYFSWQCAMPYHNQCISPDNVLCGTTTSVFLLGMCHAVKGTSHGTVWHIAKWEAVVVVPYDTLLGERHWSWYRKTHCQMKGTGQGSVGHIVMWNTQQCVIQYHDQCLSPGNVSYGTTTSATWQSVIR
jgi:hypothetical protein